jgi:hypothetical protein
LVEPIERAGLFLTEDDDVDGELLGVHASILAGENGKVRSAGEAKRVHSQEWMCYARNLREGGASHRLKFEEEKRCGRRSSLQFCRF